MDRASDVTEEEQEVILMMNSWSFNQKEIVPHHIAVFSLSLWRCFITGAHAVRLTPIIYLKRISRHKSKMFATQINTHEQIILDNRCHDEIAEDWSLYLDFLAAPDVFLTPGHQRRWLITLVSSWSVFAARGGGGWGRYQERLIKLNTSHIWWMADAITGGHFTRSWGDGNNFYF